LSGWTSPWGTLMGASVPLASMPPSPPGAPDRSRARDSRPDADSRPFFGEVLERLVRDGTLDRRMKTLVVCGGSFERDQLLALGFEDVVITNLDQRPAPESFSPYRWSLQDAERLKYPDDSFDLTIVHSGLHHCQSPHRALLEMYRIARKCALVFESRDSLAMRAACALGLTAEHELEAVVGNEFRFGGVRNTPVPNFVYRWTEREVRKTVQSHAPHARPHIRFFYGLRIPTSRLLRSRRVLIRLAARALAGVIPPLSPLLGRQRNLFAFLIEKPSLPGDLQPWMTLGPGGPTIDRQWCGARFRDAKPES